VGGARATLLAVALSVASLPVVHDVKWGQVSLLTSVLALLALSSPGRSSGPLLGALAAFKVYPAGYLLAPVVRRAWRLVLVALVVAILCGVVLPALVLGTIPSWALARIMLSSATHQDQWANGFSTAYYGGQALGPSLTRWFSDGGHVDVSPAGAPPSLVALPEAAMDVLGLVAALVLLVLTIVALARERPSAARAAALSMTTITLLAQPGWHHYFAFLPFAQAVALGDPGAPRRARVLGALSWLVAAVPLALLPLVPGIYFMYSAAGGTTIAALLAWAALWKWRSGTTAALPKLQRAAAVR
jgi:Glycosyltransferase family 87